MIRPLKSWAKRHWPRLHLRTILIGTLLFAAILPGLGAIFLRVYENTLVRQTESELVAQGAALTAAAAILWPGARATPSSGVRYLPEPPTIDLRTTPVLAERPHATIAIGPIDPAAQLAAARIAPILTQTSRTTLAAIQLIDRHAIIVFGHEQGGSYAALPEIRAALAGNTETILRRNGAYLPRYRFEWLSKASALRIHHARPVIVNGQVVGALLLSRSPRALFKGMYQDLGKILIGVVLIFGLLIVIATFLSRGISQPIAQLSEATRRVASGVGHIPPVPVTAAIEIQALFADFAVMAQEIARRSRYLRDFAAAVSHEFKTPLASMSGAIELLQDHHDAMTEVERERFLANISADADRLAKLVTRLLDMARADLAQPQPDATSNLPAVIGRVADAYRSEAFAIAVAIADGSRLAAVPASTVEAALSALIENSRQAGASQVMINVCEQGAHIGIRVVDDGPGIAPADRDRLFEPFFTSRRAEGGTGLGLPIVRSLLAASDGEIDRVDSPAGAAFLITIPGSTDGPTRS